MQGLMGINRQIFASDRQQCLKGCSTAIIQGGAWSQDEVKCLLNVGRYISFRIYYDSPLLPESATLQG